MANIADLARNANFPLHKISQPCLYLFKSVFKYKAHSKFFAFFLVLLLVLPLVACENPGDSASIKNTYSVGSVTNVDNGSCAIKQSDGELKIDANNQLVLDKNCSYLEKLVVTKPVSNVSYQFLIPIPTNNFSSNNVRVVTCVTPAAVAAGLSLSSDVSGSGGVSETGTTPTLNLQFANNQSAIQTISQISNIDAASRYIATAAFYNCLAYASGMYGQPFPGTAVQEPGAVSNTAESTAAANMIIILNNSVKVQTAASAVSNNTTNPPKAPSAPTVAALSPPVSGEVSVTITPENDPTVTGYSVTASSGGVVSGSDQNKGSNATQHIITKLTPGSSYTFTVVATSTNGDSPPSAPSDAFLVK